MRLVASAVVILVAAALCMPASAAAQEPVKSFDQLNTRVRVGDVVWVTDAQGRQVTGMIRELHDASLTLDGDGTARYEADRVRLIQRRTKSVGKAALWGLFIGGAAGMLLVVVATPGECVSDCIGRGWEIGLGAGACGGIGAGVGAAVRAALPARRKEVYRAPGASGGARLSVAPVITPRTKGVAVSFAC
jgi:hypothetical protein